ncbi:MAG TPA: HhH-GPD-type base excision DNA repair protein [Gaiellaceae bacterium]|nr:HhH-GPD-type base excision DNA repair protein [Gaiellaceae bacterium]
MATTRPERLHFTENDEADELLARDPLALLIGFVLDQQVPVQKAFSSPLVLRSRLGGLDAHAIAQMDPAELERVFRERPALHRFPGSMAARTRELCATLARDYDGDPERTWADAADAGELEARLLALPGIGPMKAKTLMAVLAKQFGVRPPGWEARMPRHPTLGDVDSTEALLAYQAQKRAHKAARRAEAAASQSESPPPR